MGMPNELIRLTVHKAKDLEKKGILGKADPYFIIKQGSQTYQSDTINNNHNPEWNYSITLDSQNVSMDAVKLEVFDEDFGKDDSMGTTSINFEDIAVEGKIVNKWIPLQNCKSGEILISAELIKKDLKPKDKKRRSYLKNPKLLDQIQRTMHFCKRKAIN